MKSAFISCLAIVLLSAAVVWFMRGPVRREAQFGDVKTLMVALSDHETQFGTYPVQLHDLVDRKLIDEAAFEKAKCRVGSTSSPREWLYRKPASNATGRSIILLLPEAVGGKRFGMLIDGSVREVPPAEVEAWLKSR